MIWKKFFVLSLRLLRGEMRNQSGFVFFFTANLALGLVGFTVLDSFKRGVESVLEQNSKAILGADLVAASRHSISAEEERNLRDLLPKDVQITRMIEMYSMVYVKERSQLVQIRAIDDRFPLYGAVELAGPADPARSSINNLNQKPMTWIYPELAEQLQLKRHDLVHIGAEKFEFTDTVLRDPGANLTGSSLAPRLYIGRQFLERTQLLRKGSTAWHSLLVKLPDGVAAEAITGEFRRLYPQSTLTLSSHRDEGRATGRILTYLGDYLSLAAIVALFLSAVGSAYLFHSFLAGKIREIAILQALGISGGQAILLYSAFVATMGLVSGFLALLFTAVLLPTTETLLQSLFHLRASVILRFPTIVTTLVLCTMVSLLVCLPALMTIYQIRPAQLFQESSLAGLRFRWQRLLYGLPAIGLLWILAILQTQSLRLGSIFTGLFLLAVILLFLVSASGLTILARRKITALPWRLALRQLTRNRLSTLTAFLAIAVGTLVVNIIPQLRSSLRGELLHPEQSRLPAFFLFDIQPEQLAPLKATLDNAGTRLSNISPLVRGQLTHVNQQPFKRQSENLVQTRESETEDRFRARGLNLTYRDGLTENEELVKGATFSKLSTKIPEISIEWRYAQRLGLAIGDELTFEVQGVPIVGKVVNLRRVRWTSFQPNFFIQFAPGALEDAPQTYLASVPQLSAQTRSRIQNQLAQDFPNISIIDVSRIIDKLLEIVEQMVWALQLMAAIAVIAGLLVLYSISRQQVAQRQREVNLLRVLGAEHPLIGAIFLREFFVISFGATLLGAGLSLLFSYALSVILFEGLWIFSWQAPLISILTIVTLSLLISASTIRRTLQQTAQAVLQST